jgi:hypothetical protein
MNLLSCKAAGELLDLGSDAVRYHAKMGRLVTILVDRGAAGPLRLFLKEDVERFRALREERSRRRGRSDTLPPGVACLSRRGWRTVRGAQSKTACVPPTLRTHAVSCNWPVMPASSLALTQ